jgi:hypothetical protein
MLALNILNDDWSLYEVKKNAAHEDSNFFASEATWEVTYLYHQIKKHYPQFSDTEILLAIRYGCATITAPRPRAQFVACVVTALVHGFRK